jgi:hypothetical protein
VTAIEDTVNGLAPVLATVTGTGADVAPIGASIAAAVGLTDIEICTPDPDSVTTPLPLLAFDAMVSVPLRVPTAVGANDN